LTTDRYLKHFMNITFFAFNCFHLFGESATHPLARPDVRLALSLILAGMSLRRLRFAPVTRPNAPSGASNRGF
jgi:hypothetical protein